MNHKDPAPPEILKIVGIALILPISALATVAYGLIAGFMVLVPLILIALALTPSSRPGRSARKLGLIDKIIYLIIALSSALLIYAIISITR